MCYAFAVAEPRAAILSRCYSDGWRAFELPTSLAVTSRQIWRCDVTFCRRYTPCYSEAKDVITSKNTTSQYFITICYLVAEVFYKDMSSWLILRWYNDDFSTVCYTVPNDDDDDDDDDDITKHVASSPHFLLIRSKISTFNSKKHNQRVSAYR
jgi:hypothetical protein